MSAKPDLSWADVAFGDLARELRHIIVGALTAASTQSRDAQDVSRARHLDPFGHSLKTLQFQELADRVTARMPDQSRAVKLDSYSLAIVSGFVLYPVRSLSARGSGAKDGQVRKPVSKLRRRLFTALGPEPRQDELWPELADEDAAADIRTLIARLGPGTRLAAISYVCTYDAGLTDIYWGEAELDAGEGALVFHEGEALTAAPVPGAASRGLRPADRAAGAGSRAFDGGDLPKLSLDPNPSRQPAAAEAEPSQPAASNDQG